MCQLAWEEAPKFAKVPPPKKNPKETFLKRQTLREKGRDTPHTDLALPAFGAYGARITFNLVSDFVCDPLLPV